MDMKLRTLLLSLAMTLSLLSGAVYAEGQVDINTASQSQLETLNGIGAKTATAIIKYREMHGNFKSVDDLVLVSGIGDQKLTKIAPQIIALIPE